MDFTNGTDKEGRIGEWNRGWTPMDADGKGQGRKAVFSGEWLVASGEGAKGAEELVN